MRYGEPEFIPINSSDGIQHGMSIHRSNNTNWCGRRTNNLDDDLWRLIDGERAVRPRIEPTVGSSRKKSMIWRELSPHWEREGRSEHRKIPRIAVHCTQRRRRWRTFPGHSLCQTRSQCNTTTKHGRTWDNTTLTTHWLLVAKLNNGSSIPCLDCVTLNVELNGAVICDFRFYVTEHGMSIMGVDLFDAFGGSVLLGGDRLVSSSLLATMPRKSVCITAVDSGRSAVSLEQFPVLLKKSGRLTGFVHRPMNDKSVKPVRQKFRHPPLAKREPIANELRRLEQEGVIERVDASLWTLKIVTAKKRDSSLRLCVKLSDVNKAIIPDTYPLPTMDELTELSAGLCFRK